MPALLKPVLAEFQTLIYVHFSECTISSLCISCLDFVTGNSGSGAGEITPWVKKACYEPWWPVFSPPDPHDGRRELSPESCPLPSTCALSHVCMRVYK